MQHDAIAVIDFGGQYAHLIATKVRRHGVLSEIRQPEDPIEQFERYRGIIVSGSPSLASHGEDSDYTRGIYDLDVPILGLCFGHQEIAKHYGGEVVHGGRQWGRADVHLTGDHPLFKGLGPIEQVWMSHYDSVTAVGPEFQELGWSVTTDGGPDHRFAAIGSDSLRRYGFQFHPEVDDTVHGDEMIANFVFEICGCEPTWSMEAFVQEEMERIRLQVADGSVFLLASGGVDSTVAATLLARALGPERLELLHVDNGLMRKDESAAVIEFFRGLGLGTNLHFVDASDRFISALDGIVEPEAKRRAIGNSFVAVFEDEARRLGVEGHLLGQGTKRADTIKPHHHRVPVIEEMLAAGRVVEPLAELYKVEVRELGEKLGIPHELVWRHPFPGPGLGVRLLCSDGVGAVEGLDDIAPLVAEEGRRFGLDAEVLPIRSVGVKADLRAYEHPVLLTGDVEWETLLRAASVLTAEVPGINRCIWNLQSAPPATAVPLAATTTNERLDVLREADHIVMEGLRRHGLYDVIWQCPTVLVPLDILGLDGVSGLALDVTSKPPGTIEWE